jgi:hypothetical protein
MRPAAPSRMLSTSPTTWRWHMSEQSKTIVRDFFDAVNLRDADRLDGLVALDVTYHGASVNGLAELKQLMRHIVDGFPDFEVTIEELVAEGDKVAAMSIETGTHRGEFEGIPPTGKSISLREVNLFRISEGRIAEVWQISDQLAFMQQLGLMPSEEEQAAG